VLISVGFGESFAKAYPFDDQPEEFRRPKFGLRSRG
jgi:hypothetical protein